MRNLRIALLLVLGPYFMPTNAQVTIGIAEMPVAGEIISLSTATGVPMGQDPAITGSDVIWDYSELELLAADADTFYTVEETPLLFQFYFNNWLLYPDHNADHARKEIDLDVGVVSLQDTYSYFKSDGDGYRYVGFGANINGLPTSVRSQPVDWIYEFPLTYGSQSESTSATNAEVPSLGSYYNETQREVNADGYGSLILPSGTYEVLRVKTEIEAYDSVYVETIQNGFGFTRLAETLYQWLSPGEHGPVLEISVTAAATVVRYKAIEPDGLMESVIKSVELYPNPSQDYLRVDAQGLDIERCRIYDISGKLIISPAFEQSDNLIQLSVTSLESGPYLLVFESEGVLYSASFIKG